MKAICNYTNDKNENDDANEETVINLSIGDHQEEHEGEIGDKKKNKSSSFSTPTNLKLNLNSRSRNQSEDIKEIILQ